MYIQNHTYSNNNSEPINQTPEVAVGLASIPAPIAVPAMIIAPPKRVGLEERWLAVITILLNSDKAAYSTHNYSVMRIKSTALLATISNHITPALHQCT